MSEIGVLIPSYKPRDYVLGCFRALESQSLSKDKFTVYLCLNGSDKSHSSFIAAALSKFSFDYSLIEVGMSGVSNARNILIRESTEPYIVFIDDDDYISNYFLEELYVFRSRERIVASQVHNTLNGVDIGPNYIGSFTRRHKCQFLASQLYSRKIFSSACAKLIPRILIGRNQFNTQLSIGEDSLFMAHISNNINEIYVSSERAIYFVNVRSDSASRSYESVFDKYGRLLNLMGKFSAILFRSGYDRVFIMSRILALFRKMF